MDKGDQIAHTIQIAGVEYPVRLTQKEKRFAAEIEKEINDKIQEYEKQFLVGSKRDLLAMVLLTYAFDSKLENSADDDMSNAHQKIQRILKLFPSNEEE